jgi:hypothetical protein
MAPHFGRPPCFSRALITNACELSCSATGAMAPRRDRRGRAVPWEGEAAVIGQGREPNRNGQEARDQPQQRLRWRSAGISPVFFSNMVPTRTRGANRGPAANPYGSQPVMMERNWRGEASGDL